MARYKDMVMAAKKKGVANETSMWKSIDDVDYLMEMLRESHPDIYWHKMRKAHEHLYGCHYDEEYAEWDIEQMHSMKDGKHYEGHHWTKPEVVSAWQGKVFQSGVTDCDKWVAANAIWHDLHAHYGDTDVLDIAYLFFFADDDWEGSGKIWQYMSANKKYKN